MGFFENLFGKPSLQSNNVKGTLATDAGMLCMWDANSFAGITDYDTWEAQLCEDEDIVRHIEAGKFVPLNMKCDGAFAVDIRQANPETLNERERQYLLVPAHPYLLRTSGKVVISGLEHVSSDPGSYLELNLPAGDYQVQANMIDWSMDPESTVNNGEPSANALPDMIVFVNPIPENAPEFRKSVETFRKEDALR